MPLVTITVIKTSRSTKKINQLEMPRSLRWCATLCCYAVGALLVSIVDGLPSQVEVDVVAEFLVATQYTSALPVTRDNLCTSWAPMIVCSNKETVLGLNFTGANLKGTLPATLSQLKSITRFDVSNNSITGSIPHQWSAWGRGIISVNISHNNLTGTLPPELSNWSSIVEFSLSNNQLNGTLPAVFSSMVRLWTCELSFNMLSGTLPSSWKSFSEITKFTVGSNELFGPLPPEYSLWNFILTFSVDRNAITGTLPPEYANWTRIVVLVLNNNLLSGTLPAEYSLTWTLISIMRLRNNSFQGTLPAEYSRLPMTVFDASSNQLIGSLPPQYAAWRSAESIVLSNNMLTGTIPSSWGHIAMPLLRTFLLYNNSLSGTVFSSLALFQSLNVLSISSNDFSGTLPNPSIWPQLLILDVQNNTKLSGPIPPQLFVTLLFVQLAAFSVSPRSCFATSVAPLSTVPFPSGKIIATYESPPTSSTNAICGVATATALGAALAAVDAADAQMLVSILGSPCVCSTTLTAQQQEGSVLLLALSPFSPLGSVWAAIGNSLLCCVFVGMHATAVFFTTALSTEVPQSIQKPSSSSKRIATHTLLGRWLETHKSSDSRRRRKVLAQLRFPNISVTLLMLLVPGVVRACMATANSSFNPGDEDSPSALSAASIAIGVVFVLCACGFVELFAYRHANVELIAGGYSTRSKGSKEMPSPMTSREQLLLHFVRHQHPTRLFKPIPRGIASVALPQGSWEPQTARTAYGGVVSSYLARWRRAWVVVPGSNIVVQLLNGVGGDDTTCDALQTVTLLVLASVCAFIAYARPHRALLASYLVCASLVLTMVTALLGLLCRHGAVSPDAVSGFGVFASVAMFVFKLYHVLMPIVERRLMARNGAVSTIASASFNTQQQVTLSRVETTSFNDVSSPYRLDNRNSASAPEALKKKNIVLHVLDYQRKISAEQLDVLRELILMVSIEKNYCSKAMVAVPTVNGEATHQHHLAML